MAHETSVPNTDKMRSKTMPKPQLLLAAALIIAGLDPPALARTQAKSAAEIKTEAIEASVTIDPALSADPRLYNDLIVRGKREMAKWRAEAEKDRREDPSIFRNDRRYDMERIYDRRSRIGPYVSVVRIDYFDTLGAHPNVEIDTLLWNAATHKFISIRPFFKETASGGPTLRTLAKAVRAAVLAEKKVRGIPVQEAADPMWLGGIKPDLTKIGGVALAPSTERDKSAGFLFYFSPSTVGAYVEGPYTVFVPWTGFAPHLSRTGAELFGGSRLPGDAKNDRP
jgi:hypothetical protein